MTRSGLPTAAFSSASSAASHITNPRQRRTRQGPQRSDRRSGRTGRAGRRCEGRCLRHGGLCRPALQGWKQWRETVIAKDLKMPEGIALTPDGKLIVAEVGAKRIVE